jgi:hypothetical protein
MAWKYLKWVSIFHSSKSGARGLLLGLFMEFLGLLLKLFEASLGIEVDGILCDLALRVVVLAGAPRLPAAGAKGWIANMGHVGFNVRG